MQSGEVMITMTGDFLITEWNLSGSSGKRMVKPRFQKTVDGFLLTGYQSESLNRLAQALRLRWTSISNIRMSAGMKLPHKVRFSGMHGSEPVEAELVFRVNG